jgi:hypothetical protein
MIVTSSMIYFAKEVITILPIKAKIIQKYELMSVSFRMMIGSEAKYIKDDV